MTVINEWRPVTAIAQVADETFALRFDAPQLARVILPGQFINVLVDEGTDPLLRRPYSISNVHGTECELLFSVVGKGTGILSRKRVGDTIGVLGPLGNTFGYDREFGTAIIVAGGIGVAPFPYLTRELQQRDIPLLTFLGARTAGRVVRAGLENLHVATDDGSEGFHGTVLACLDAHLSAHAVELPRIFACGPNPMLKAVQAYANERGIACELSLESEMACGVGICQGCPIEHTHRDRKYALVCTDGPCFDAHDIIFHDHHAA